MPAMEGKGTEAEEMNARKINEILGINESFKLPERLMGILLTDPEKMFDEFMAIGEPLDHDWFTEYFEEEHSNKTKMAQDFTPKEVCELLSHVTGKAETIADICAGTGGLTIGMWVKNPEAFFVCYEYSERAIPLLCFNLAIRNIPAFVKRCDILTGETFEVYKISEGERYGRIKKVGYDPEIKADAVISNPPYSQKYAPDKDDRFEAYKGMLPSNFADFVFVAFALENMNEKATAGFILPHGVLFRSGKEKKFREMLLEQGMIKTIIGLPDKLFINTDIPTCILQLRKDGKTDDILVIDASKEFVKDKSKNRLAEKNMSRIKTQIDTREEAKKFAHLASMDEIRENDYNLNIPRYVDTFEAEVLPDVVETLANLAKLEREATAQLLELMDMVSIMEGTTPEADREHKKAIDAYVQTVKDEQEKKDRKVLRYDYENRTA